MPKLYNLVSGVESIFPCGVPICLVLGLASISI